MIALHFGSSRTFRRVFLAASLVFWVCAAAITAFFLFRIIRTPVKGGIGLNVFVAAFTLIWFAGVHAMVMTAWKATSLSDGIRFWAMVFSPRPSGTLETSAWQWARTFLALWVLCALMLFGLYAAGNMGLVGRP